MTPFISNPAMPVPVNDISGMNTHTCTCMHTSLHITDLVHTVGIKKTSRFRSVFLPIIISRSVLSVYCGQTVLALAVNLSAITSRVREA